MGSRKLDPALIAGQPAEPAEPLAPVNLGAQAGHLNAGVSCQLGKVVDSDSGSIEVGNGYGIGVLESCEVQNGLMCRPWHQQLNRTHCCHANLDYIGASAMGQHCADAEADAASALLPLSLMLFKMSAKD